MKHTPPSMLQITYQTIRHRQNRETFIWGKLGLVHAAGAASNIRDFIHMDAPIARFGRLWRIIFVASAVTLWNVGNAQTYENFFGRTCILIMWPLRCYCFDVTESRIKKLSN